MAIDTLIYIAPNSGGYTDPTSGEYYKPGDMAGFDSNVTAELEEANRIIASGAGFNAGALAQAVALAWVNITGKPATFPPSAHTHAASDITSGQFADPRISESSVTQHQSAFELAQSQVTGLLAALAAKANAADVDTSGAVDAKIAAALTALIDSAPGALDTLNELAAALGDDANFAATVTAALATKLDASVYTAADVLAKLLGVDGAGSGVDADLLDGEQGAHYLDPSNHAGAQAVQTADFTATHGRRWPCDTSAGGFTVTLSDAVPVGQSVRLYDPSASWLSNWLRVLPAAGTGEIVGVEPGEPLIGDMAGVELTFTREISGWSWTSTQPALSLEIYA